MRSRQDADGAARRQEFIDPDDQEDARKAVTRLGDDWGWFSDPLLEIPEPIYDSIAHARGEQNARRELRSRGVG
jgi:hypothetical protein